LGGERCKFLPSRLLHATNKITREPDFAFRDNGLDVRVFGNTVYFYRILRSGEISDEYLVVDFQGVGETTTNVITGFPDETTHFRQSIIYGFDDLQKDPNKPLYYLTIKTAKPFHAKGVIIMLLDPDVVPYGTLKYEQLFFSLFFFVFFLLALACLFFPFLFIIALMLVDSRRISPSGSLTRQRITLRSTRLLP
jgi:hypothetical protein